MRNFLLVLALILITTGGAQAVYDSVTAAEAQDLTILRVTPTGEDVYSERQIVITFNRPVVPIGQMERDKKDIPVTITPEVDCEWRWINTSSLACQLTDKSKLELSTKYDITIAPGIKAEDGTTIKEDYKATFITQRANVEYAWFRTWTSPGTPVIRLTFNQPVTKTSARKSITLVHGEKKTGIKLKPDPDYDEKPSYVPFGKGWLFFGKQERLKSDDQATEKDGEEARRVWLAEPVEELPFDTNVTMKLAPGLVSAMGPELSVATKDVVAFDTYPELSVLGVRCTTNAGLDVLFAPGETRADKCNPMAAITLSFSAPVQRSQVKKNFEFSPALGLAEKQDEIWGDVSEEYSRLNSAHTKGRGYDVYLPYGLKAASTYTVKLKGEELGFFARAWRWVKNIFTDQPMTALQDEFARRVKEPLTITFNTDHRKPNFEMDYHDAVLEKNADSEVPIYVNNLEKLTFGFRSLTADGAKDAGKFEQTLENIMDIQYLIPMKVREMLKGKSGAVYGHLETSPYVDKGSESNYRLFAQVTPWQMNVKLGHFSTLVWLTDMATGAPVKGAKVTLYKDAVSSLTAPQDIRGTGVTDADGLATLPGTDKADPQQELQKGWEDSDPKLFVRAEKGDDMAVMPLNSSFMIDIWRASNESIYPSNKKKYGHIHTWGTTAQGIYRAGDTIQYKFYVRDQDDRTLIAAPKEGYKLEIVDPTDNVVETVEDLKLNDFGAYAGEFKVAKEAPVGWYRFRLTAKYVGEGKDDGEGGEYSDYGYEAFGTWTPLRVLVTDFTPVPFRVSNSLNGDLFHDGQDVEVSADAKLHSGGPYLDAEVRTVAILDERAFTSKHPKAQGFYFMPLDYSMHGSREVLNKTEPLDGKGELRTTFKIEKQDFAYGRLTVESAVQDDRGKNVAASTGADFVGVDRFVGLKSPEWAYEAKKPVNLEYIVVDDRGNPAAGTAVKITLERLETTAVRVKGAGDAYLTNYNSEWKEAGTCEGTSTDDVLPCAFTPDKAGSYRATARIKDTKDRAQEAGVGFWVTGSDYLVWDNQSDVLLPIVPEKAEYKVGDTAKYLVKNPFPGATALVTIERYGIIDKFTTKLEGSTPVVEFPVKADYLPGFFLSIQVFSPRVDKPIDENGVDLGKPTFRMGYVTVPVKDPYKEMLVTAKTPEEVYKPRDKIKVSLHAEPKKKGRDEPVEIAVAVLDEAVFDLVTGGLSNFDPYEGFYKLDGLDLRNYSLLTRLIGRQKFEKKGANQGGDGGSDLKVRDLFKFVAYWNPSIKTDKNGNAEVEFDAPDNLTGWRILALAVTPSDRLGLGHANFKVNRPTEVRPVMPNQVTERDTFQAGFSVMNRTDKPRTLTVEINAEGLIDTAKTPAEHKETVTVDPYKRAIVYMPVQTMAVPENRDLPQGELKFTVKAYDLQDGDGVVHAMPVNKMRSLDTAANYGTTTQDKATESIKFPDNIFPDVGGISVVLSPSVIGSVEGAFKYMRDYPYICWEQILTKGVMASHYLNLKGYMPDSFEWKDADKLAQAALDVAGAFQAPNGGMTYFLARDEYVDPYLSAYTALAFNWLSKSGYKIPKGVEGKLHDYLLNLLRNDVAPTFYDAGMKSTVRAVALAALADHGKVTKSDMDRYQPHVKEMSLFGKTHFLMAALKVTDALPMAKDVANNILSASNQTGGKFIFNESLDDSYSRILASPLRENCAILSAFTAYGEMKEGAGLVGDVPFKLTRTITQTRENRDHWENTQENMFCMNALIDYSRVYENVKPDMKISASLNTKGFGEAEFTDLRDKQVTLSRPMEEADVGTKATVEIERKGEGRLYYATRLRYALRSNLTKPVNAGIELHREYALERDGKWQMLKEKDEIKRGDIVRVDLFLSLPAARNFVAVNDPVPGGLEPVNSELATTSQVDANKGEFERDGGSWFFKFGDWSGYNVSRWSFYHQELRHDSVRFYSDYLPAGNYHLSYTAQAIAEGKFTVMPTLAEEMYDPDVYGKDVTRELSVSGKE